MGEIVTTIFNGYQKMIKTVSNSHIRLTILAVTESPLTLRVFSYLNTSIVHVPPTNFLFHYVVGVLRCSFPLLLCPLLYLLHFIFSPLFLSFLVIMRGSVSKGKVEKDIERPKSLRKGKPNSKWEITSDKAKW